MRWTSPRPSFKSEHPPPGAVVLRQLDVAAIVPMLVGNGRKAAMVDRIFSNRPRGTMTSAIWKVMDRVWPTIFAPIFASLSRSVVMEGQCGRRRDPYA